MVVFMLIKVNIKGDKEEINMNDVIIIGAGPAGLTSAIYAKRAGLNPIVIEGGQAGGQVLSTYEIENYPALPGISGMELGTKMKDHAIKLGVNIISESVTQVDFDKKLVVAGGVEYIAKAIIIASGAIHAKLGLEREDDLVGMGVSYCATCDGAFYKGADVAVVGGGDVALEDALFLARGCKKVYLVHRRDSFRGAKYLQERVESTPNIEIIYDAVVTDLIGEDELEALTVENVKTKEQMTLMVEGVFIAVGINPVSNLFPDSLQKDDRGYVIAGEDCRTNIPGIYVAGDVRKKPLRQIVTAVADGANAIESLINDFK